MNKGSNGRKYLIPIFAILIAIPLLAFLSSLFFPQRTIDDQLGVKLYHPRKWVVSRLEDMLIVSPNSLNEYDDFFEAISENSFVGIKVEPISEYISDNYVPETTEELLEHLNIKEDDSLLRDTPGPPIIKTVNKAKYGSIPGSIEIESYYNGFEKTEIREFWFLSKNKLYRVFVGQLSTENESIKNQLIEVVKSVTLI